MKSIIVLLFLGLIPFTSYDVYGKDIVKGLKENCEPSGFWADKWSRMTPKAYWIDIENKLEFKKKIQGFFPIQTDSQINLEVNNLRQKYIQVTGDVKKADEIAKNNRRMFLLRRKHFIFSNQISIRNLKIIERCLPIVEQKFKEAR
jgi:hypothetical protein